MTTARQLITGSLRLLNVVQANEEPTDGDMNIALEGLNALIDSKSDELLNSHTIQPYRFVTTPDTFQYTLGPGGDWDVTRPMRVEKAVVVLNPNFEE